MDYLCSSRHIWYFHENKVYLKCNDNRHSLYHCIEYYKIILVAFRDGNRHFILVLQLCGLCYKSFNLCSISPIYTCVCVCVCVCTGLYYIVVPTRIVKPEIKKINTNKIKQLINILNDVFSFLFFLFF